MAVVVAVVPTWASLTTTAVVKNIDDGRNRLASLETTTAIFLDTASLVARELFRILLTAGTCFVAIVDQISDAEGGAFTVSLNFMVGAADAAFCRSSLSCSSRSFRSFLILALLIRRKAVTIDSRIGPYFSYKTVSHMPSMYTTEHRAESSAHMYIYHLGRSEQCIDPYSDLII